MLGALSLIGTQVGELEDADLLVAQTLAHIACVAVLQNHPPTPDTIVPPLRSALGNRTVVEQSKGYLRELFDIFLAEAFTRLRTFAHAHDDHLSDVARRIIGDPVARQLIFTKMAGTRSA